MGVRRPTVRRGRQLDVTVRWAGVNPLCSDARGATASYAHTDHEFDAGLAKAGADDGAGVESGGASRQAASVADSRETGARGELGVSGV